MARPRHARALVRDAFGHRIPEPHRPAYRMTALVTALAATTTTLTAAPPPAGATVSPHNGRAIPNPAPARGGTYVLAAHIARFPANPMPSRAPRPAPAAAPAENRRAGPAPAPGHRTPSAEVAPPFRPPPRPADTPRTGQATVLSAPEEHVSPGDELPELPKSLRLEHRFAEFTLRANGIGRRSTGHCSDRTVRTCTSFEGVRWGTVEGLIGFAESSGCEITVTGGTERGHASGTYSHANGYKLDIAPGRCVDAAIKRYPSTGVRGDGARLYRSPDRTVFAREKDHWDISFR